MMDFWLQDNDLKSENGDLFLCPTDTDALVQAIKIRLKTLAGEWFLDTGAGVPYLTEVFGYKQSVAFMRSVILPQIESLAEVKSVNDFSLEVDSARTARIKFMATLTDQRNIHFTESVEI